MAETLITAKQFSARLGLTPKALKNLIARKRQGDTSVTIPLPDLYLGPRSARWRASTVDTYLCSQLEPA